MSVNSRCALITGASRGIGRELAVGLAARGWAMGLLARNRWALEGVAAQCRELGVAVSVADADVVDRAAVERAVWTLIDELGGVNLLVNNAGIIESTEADFGSTDVDETWRVVEVNARGPMLVTYAVLSTMVDAGGGRIVNINSGAAHDVRPVYTGSTVGKGALARFTAQVDAQFRDRGVRAFDLSPGVVRTDMTAAMPMHNGRTEWTPPAKVVELVAAIGEGLLDELGGRFFRAGVDTVASLLDNRTAILDANARVLRYVAEARPGRRPTGLAGRRGSRQHIERGPRARVTFRPPDRPSRGPVSPIGSRFPCGRAPVSGASGRDASIRWSWMPMIRLSVRYVQRDSELSWLHRKGADATLHVPDRRDTCCAPSVRLRGHRSVAGGGHRRTQPHAAASAGRLTVPDADRRTG